jgi:hypothetical protein
MVTKVNTTAREMFVTLVIKTTEGTTVTKLIIKPKAKLISKLPW